MDDVALICGMSKKTLYRFFESKGELAHAVVEKFVLKSEQFLRVCPCISPDAGSEMNNLFKYISGILNILPLSLCREIRKYYPHAWKLVVEFREKKLYPFIIQNFNRGISENMYQAGFDKEKTSWFYLWHLNIAVEDTSLNMEKRHQLLAHVNNCLLKSILNVKGLKKMYLTY
ncbi:hypothetical protein A3860_34915 [Niastella vici]|uniref:HTH tetR-type domain-containing protein n=2 Tax=Niastella vici TaxID=1703345 RepID=A0A1V9FP55_9BACT|nr:hypothetical protein A3860_34915 [Niastella vici]